MDYKIHIVEDLDIKSNQILNDYWSIQNGNFLYKATEITQMHNITKAELTKLVQKNSHCEINHGNCQLCDEEIKVKITSKTEYISSIRYKINRCSKCSIEIKRRIAQQERDELENRWKENRLKFDIAVIEKKWLELPENELTMLYSLIQNKTKNKIYDNVFGGNCFDKSIWKYVNKFENLGFINIIRNGNSIITFEFDERINEAIRKLLHIKSEANIDHTPSVLNDLSFSLTRKENKETIRQPDYGGTFILQRDVLLSANVKYIYGGWIQTDGSINLKFTPASDIKSNIVTQEEIGNEPELVGEIMKNMFNEIPKVTRELPTSEEAFGAWYSSSYEDEEDDEGEVPF